MDISEFAIYVWNNFEKFYFPLPHVLHILRNLFENTDVTLHVVLDKLSLRSLRNVWDVCNAILELDAFSR